MRKIKENKVGSIIIFLFVIAGILFFIKKITYVKYEKNYFYLDTYINIKIYSNKTGSEVNKLFDEIDYLYSEYHKLTDKYNKYDDVINIYYLNEILENEEEIEIDPRLSKLINLGIEYYEKTEGYINIASSNLIDVWKCYIEKEEGIPSQYELNNANTNILDISLKDNIYKKRNDIKIDTKGYITELVGEYLEENGIDKYLIDAGGNIKVGNNYKKDNYIIGIQNPINTNEVFIKLNVNNLSIVTSGDYQRYYEYENVRYNHIINPYTKYPSNNFKSVTVVSENSYLADIYSTYLFLIDLDKGLEIINNNDELAAIWYVDEDNIVKSNNFNYE